MPEAGGSFVPAGSHLGVANSWCWFWLTLLRYYHSAKMASGEIFTMFSLM